jgi:SAM-dependent methyltransferase
MRQVSEAAERNKQPILAVLRGALPARGLVLEVASGTGQHVAHLAAALPHLLFQPSDPLFANHASIRSWTEGLVNVRPPLAIDVEDEAWGISAADAILAINLIHIAPWSACLGLLAGAARLLPPDGLLYLYGPFAEAGLHVSASNAAFDRSLRERDPAWGVRDLVDVADAARAAGFRVERVEAMPANNRSVLLRRAVAEAADGPADPVPGAPHLRLVGGGGPAAA